MPKNKKPSLDIGILTYPQLDSPALPFVSFTHCKQNMDSMLFPVSLYLWLQ